MNSLVIIIKKCKIEKMFPFLQDTANKVLLKPQRHKFNISRISMTVWIKHRKLTDIKYKMNEFWICHPTFCFSLNVEMHLKGLISTWTKVHCKENINNRQLKLLIQNSLTFWSKTSELFIAIAFLYTS